MNKILISAEPLKRRLNKMVHILYQMGFFFNSLFALSLNQNSLFWLECVF